MVLRFNSKEDFMEYFNEENNTIHTDLLATHKFFGEKPQNYPVLIQSGPSRLLSDIVFQRVDTSSLKPEELQRLNMQADYNERKMAESMQVRSALG